MPLHPADVQVRTFPLAPHGFFPNNEAQPSILYSQAFGDENDLAAAINSTFEQNGWTHGWRDTIYEYHHYHTTAHEVLGCYQGQAEIMLGGPGGRMIHLSAGDVLVVSAGTSHKRIESSDDFQVVGCYAAGKAYDMKLGKETELAAAQRSLRELELPKTDPVWGRKGPLIELWIERV